MSMIKKILTVSNWKKTYYYLKKNGVKSAVLAAMERLEKSDNDSYVYEAPTEEALAFQREDSRRGEILFSILVPVYCTPKQYFLEMIRSVLAQSYPNWELLLGDASPDDRLGEMVREINDKRVRYIRIPENRGISANTNVVLREAAGSFIGLLDHDDVLTPDALYLVYKCIQDSRRQGVFPRLIYSDEDKGDGNMRRFYDENRKPAFDQDYLWSNHYICHFTVMEGTLMKRLAFRPEFDGAQDYDLVLRACREIQKERKEKKINSQVLNISKVLYHWRCHRDSTAVNPQSKRYAYEAGKRAVEEDLKVRGIEAEVHHSKHLGFYRVTYQDIFRDRPEAAMVAGPVYKRGRICGGALREDGSVLYDGLKKGYSGGHLHRASVWQKCDMADFTNAVCREALWEQFLKEQGFSEAVRPKEAPPHFREAWAAFVRRQGMLILYDPERA